jgi:hypothetical protein
MYHYIDDKDFLKRMRGLCSGIINQLVQRINNDSVMTVEAHLVGSGAKNLETQNENNPIDLDYNLCILSTEKMYINDCRSIKEYIRKQFNVVLNANGWSDCQDSRSVLSTQKQRFTTGNSTEFSIDVAIVVEGDEQWFRLIHEKGGLVACDRYYWNAAPHSEELSAKVAKLKEYNLWKEVRDAYLEKKNMYLRRQDKKHPSFNVYIEAVNEVYYRNFH